MVVFFVDAHFLVNDPCEFDFSLVFFVTMFAWSREGAVTWVVGPTVPLSSVGAIRDVGFLPSVDGSNYLVLRVFVFVTQETYSYFEGPCEAPSVSLVLILQGAGPFVRCFGVLRYRVFHVRERDHLDIVPDAEVSRLYQVAITYRQPRRVAFDLAGRVRRVGRVPRFVPTATNNGVPPVQREGRRF